MFSFAFPAFSYQRASARCSRFGMPLEGDRQLRLIAVRSGTGKKSVFGPCSTLIVNGFSASLFLTFLFPRRATTRDATRSYGRRYPSPQINRAVFLAMSTGAICGTGALKATSPLKRALGSTTAANLAGLSLLLSVTSSERMLMRPRDIMLRAWRAISCFSASSFSCSFRIMVMYYLGNVVNRTRMKATHRVLSGLAGDEAQ